MALRKRNSGTCVDHYTARLQMTLHLIGIESRKLRKIVVLMWTETIEFGEASEVGGEGAKPVK